MERMITIYKLTAPNGKSYVGQTLDLHRRFLTYKGMRCKGQQKLYRALKKYGWENFTKEILECIPIELKDEYEQHYISIFKCDLDGLNLTSGGCVNSIPSESARLKMSIAQKGRKHANATKLKMSIAAKGRKSSDATRHNMSMAQKNRSEETRQKIRDSKKNLSKESRQRISNAQKGKKHSDATKSKMSIARKGMQFSTEHKLNLSIVKKEWWIKRKLKNKVA